MSRLVDQIKRAIDAFVGCGTTLALIAGLVLAVLRWRGLPGTGDSLADADDAGRLPDILLGLGYRSVHRSEDAANYLRSLAVPGIPTRTSQN